MKKKIFTLIFVLTSLLTFAQTTDTLELTGVGSGSEFYYCNTVDTVIVYKPNGSGVGIFQHPGIMDLEQDSVIITHTNQGQWMWDDGTPIVFYVHFVSISPEESWDIADTSKCPESSIVLNAQAVNHQDDFNYEWAFDGTPMTQTSQQITVSDEGIYSVTITGACGSMNDYIEVINYDSPTPDLGQDMVDVCDWDAPTLDPGTFQEYDWSTGDNSSTIVAYGTNTYAVTVTDDNGCTASDEIDISFYVNPGIEISIVTVDTTNGNNRIVWDTDIPDFQTHLVKIWRNGATNDINNEVGVVQYTDGEFTDTVNSESRTWRYAITANDDCGNWAELSPYHESMKISLLGMAGGGIQVEWTPYGMGSKSVSSYYLYSVQGFGSAWIATPIDVVPGTQTSYDLPLVSDSLYIVGAEIGAKNTSEMAISMIDNPEIITEISDDLKSEFSLYPNPAKDHFMIIGEGNVEIYDMLGKQIKNFPVYSNQKVALKSGVYFVRFTDKNTKQTFTKKVIIQ
jgi:hypothetical protein